MCQWNQRRSRWTDQNSSSRSNTIHEMQCSQYYIDSATQNLIKMAGANQSHLQQHLSLSLGFDPRRKNTHIAASKNTPYIVASGRSLRYGIQCTVLIISVANPTTLFYIWGPERDSPRAACVYFMGIFSGCMSSNNVSLANWCALLLPSVCYGDLLGRHGYLSSLPRLLHECLPLYVLSACTWLALVNFILYIQKVIIMLACMSFFQHLRARSFAPAIHYAVTKML